MTDYSIDIIKDTSYTIELNEQGPQGIQGERGIQGPEGPIGPKGDKGDVGEKGDTGVSVVGVEQISKVGLVATYRMTFSNGEYFDYQVKDGSIDGLTREEIISIIGYEPASYTSIEGLTTRVSTLEERVADIQTSLDSKQDKLTAGENIAIVDNVISAKSGGSGLEVCDIGMALYVDETKGLRRYLNGQIVDINTNTQAFLNRLKQITTLHPSLLCTEEEWQTAKTMSAFGQVGKFVFNYSGENIVSVRLPRVVNIQGLFDLQNLGMTVEAGLPIHKHTRGTMNITGEWVSYAGLQEGAYPEGAVYSKSTVATGSMSGGGDPKQRLAFDASRSWTGSTSVPDNPIYGNSDTVQQEAIQYPYFIQIATGQETENNIVNEIELNTPSFFGDSKYVPTKVNNLSWLKSEGQNNPKGTYPSFYDWILENVNKGEKGFKLSTATDITDYDFVINTTDETFRLPLLNGEENIISDKCDELTLKTSGTGYTAPANGWYFLDKTATASGQYTQLLRYKNGVLIDYNFARSAYSTTLTNYLKVCKGDTVTTVYTADGGTNRFRFIYAKGNGSLYYYVGETVQNANLIDAGRIGEILPTKLDASKVKAYIVETYQNGKSGYILYSNGWCKQWGMQTGNGTYTHQKTTLLKKYRDTNYLIYGTHINWSSNNNVWYTGTGVVNQQTMLDIIGTPSEVGNKSTTGFYLPAFTNHNWITEGFLAEGEY